MKRFFGEPSTRWASLRNRLHVYVLPDRELRSALTERQGVLGAFDFCSVQPADYLHATVQQFATTSEQVSPADLETFLDRLGNLAAGTAPFEVELGAPLVDDCGIGVRGAATPAWTRLLDGVRAAAADTVNRGRPLPGPPSVPHVTLGYGLSEGSSEELQLASDRFSTEAVPPLAVTDVHFLAVHQDTEQGTFTWDGTLRKAFGA